MKFAFKRNDKWKHKGARSKAIFMSVSLAAARPERANNGV